MQEKKNKRSNQSDNILTGYTFTPNQQKFLDALRDNLAVISKAAHACNLHRNNHFNWIKNCPEYKEEYEAILDECLDFAENALLEQISNSDTTAIIFYLKTKGKKRGYIERIDQEIKVIEKKQIFKIGDSEIEF